MISIEFEEDEFLLANNFFLQIKIIEFFIIKNHRFFRKL